MRDDRDTIEMLDDGTVRMVLHMPPEDARSLGRVMRWHAEKGKVTEETARRWQSIARAIRKYVVSPAFCYRSYLIRPASTEPPNEVAMSLVERGCEPYPVLSHPDMWAVWRRLEAKGLSAKEIGKRLYVTERSVVRWRKAEREGDGDSDTTTAHRDR